MKNLGLFLVLHWSLGVSGTDCVGTVAIVTVWHRRLGLGTGNRDVDGLEKKPNLEPSLGVGLVLLLLGSCCFSLGSFNSPSREMDVQNALRHLKTIFSSL
ncbi:unnamed protein product [Camellia sinensis]